METTRLIITRTKGESVVLDGPGTVRLIQNQGKRSKWAITAPPTTRIVRGELLEHDDDNPEAIGGADDARA